MLDCAGEPNADQAVLAEQAIFYERSIGTWVGRPSLKSYEDSFFTLYTFFTAILTLGAKSHGLQSLINAGFAGNSVVITSEIRGFQ